MSDFKRKGKRTRLRNFGSAAGVDSGGVGVDVATDVAEEESVSSAFRQARESFGPIEILVTCPAIVTPGTTHELRLDDWNLVLNVNLTGTFLCAKHALHDMIKLENGSIVTLGSVASFMGIAAGNAVSYAASKGAVLQFTKNIAVEYASRGIRANCVCPGWVDTPIRENSTSVNSRLTTPPSSLPRITKVSPLARSARPEELASVIAFLASEESSFMTGTMTVADGGYSII